MPSVSAEYEDLTALASRWLTGLIEEVGPISALEMLHASCGLAGVRPPGQVKAPSESDRVWSPNNGIDFYLIGSK